MHGGDIYRNEIELDFSVNINPNGVPKTVVTAMEQGIREITHYPDIACEELKNQIAKWWNAKLMVGVTKDAKEYGKNPIIEPDYILCGNGASELLMAIVHGLKPSKALLAAPGFLGYEHALKALSCEIVRFYPDEKKDFAYDENLIKEIKEQKPDLVMLANPSNPVGSLKDKVFLKQIAEVCEKLSVYLILDECFLALTGKDSEYSMIGELSHHPNLLVLRAFTKSFAIPGIRLGYLAGRNKMLMERIKRQLPEWNVSVPSQLAGIACLKENAYLERSILQIETERHFLKNGLERLGFRVYRSYANYLLFQSENNDLYEKLLKKKILIRDCSNYEGLSKGFYRIAVKTHEENVRLLDVLKEIR